MGFANILGQVKPLSIINAYIEGSAFSGGFIFSGPEGIGKLMTAKIIAQKLNCTSSTDKPCGICEACIKMEKLNHPDLHLIQNGDAQIKIEDIRLILREASFRPYEGQMKVFIIDNAHKLNIEAANSLLKILEEPPKQSLIILITHKPQSIIKTILSRCKVIRFAPLERSSLQNILTKNYFLDASSAHFVAYYAEGRLGLALRLKDSLQLMEKNKIFDAFVLSQKPLDRSLATQNKEQLRSTLNILAAWFRDLYLLKAGCSENEIINLDRKNDLLKLIPKFSFKQLDDIVSSISESMLYLEKNINSKLLLHNLGAQLWKG
ncbi:MAG: DNA polymerase III subunit delta' [Candidatus Omnitrophota bacterium]